MTLHRLPTRNELMQLTPREADAAFIAAGRVTLDDVLPAADIAEVLSGEQDYAVRRSDLLARAERLAQDVDAMAGQRPAGTERLTVEAARADQYPLRRQLDRIRGLETGLRSL